MAELPNPDIYYTKPDLELLQQKAADYASSFPTNTCTSLYRCKPKRYFDEIQQNDGIMKIYPKDNTGRVPHGDPFSPINSLTPSERPHGLFFTANVTGSSGLLPKFSPFGNTRLVVPIEELITEEMNMYFADFYCAPSRKKGHCVNIILAKPDTDIYSFCEKYLIRIDKSDNPFLCCVNVCGIWSVRHTPWVDLLYTEDFDISEEHLESIRGRIEALPSAFEGLARNPKVKSSLCKTCNISWTSPEDELRYLTMKTSYSLRC